MQIREIIGANIKLRRLALGLSRRELAIRLGVDQSLLYKWETGRHRPSDEHMAHLSLTLDREIAWFYEQGGE